MQEPKAGRRIVSRAEYFRVQEQRVVTSMAGLGILTVALLLLYGSFFFLTQQVRFFHGLGGVFVFVMFGLCAHGLLNKSRTLIKQAIQLDPGVPLTRANTADLPAPDSLVRASQEPAQVQEGVLLRAATQDTAPSAEQLLRASGKQGQE